MTAILDAGPLVTYGDRSDPAYTEVEAFLREESGRLVIPAPVTAEVDHLLRSRVGPEPARLFAEDVAAGRFEVACLEKDDYQLIADLDRRYADLRVGLADLSIVVLAARLETRRILTFDERDFRSITPLQGGTFTILPRDAQ